MHQNLVQLFEFTIDTLSTGLFSGVSGPRLVHSKDMAFCVLLLFEFFQYVSCTGTSKVGPVSQIDMGTESTTEDSPAQI